MRVGFYVHYHGLGHKHRAESFLRHLTVPASIITSRIDTLPWQGPTLTEVVGLACDNDGVHEDGAKHAEQVPALHYAPLWTDTITRRVSQYAAWLDRAKPDLVVVDVSAEISMLTRLASIPQIVVRQHGNRDDPGHVNAYAAAHSLLAPFPEIMEDSSTPAWVRDKTVYLNGFCKAADRRDSSDRTVKGNGSAQRPTVVALFGRGGSTDVFCELVSAATSVREYDWLVVGKDSPNDRNLPDNLHFLGWVDDPGSFMASADLVVTAAGHNSVMEAGRIGRPMIAIAEPRPFDEQVHKADILQRERLAVGLHRWPSAQQWPAIIRQAKQLKMSVWETIFQKDGAIQGAEHICKVAHWSHQLRKHGARADR